MKIIALTLMVSFLFMVTAGCAGQTATSHTVPTTSPAGQPDDVLETPGGLTYRANVYQQGTTTPEPSIQTSTVLIGTSPRPGPIQVTYRDNIETKAGETRHNIFVIVAPSGGSGDAATPQVAISTSLLPQGVTAAVSDNWTGPGGWSEIAFSISISKSVNPGAYSLGYEASVNGEVPYLLQCTITVVK